MAHRFKGAMEQRHSFTDRLIYCKDFQIAFEPLDGYTFFINFDLSKSQIMKFVYTLIIYIYTGLINLVSLFNPKALLWVKGRRNWSSNLKKTFREGEKNLWFHCASLGEFEQGRPLIEMIKVKAPEIKIVLTFFSPSGYETMKEYKFADYICYLPADTPGNASDFISIINPSVVIFVKYEFWHNYISEVRMRNIPLYLISGIFRPDQHFFKWYGGFFRNILKSFTHIFVQDKRSCDLLQGIGIENITIAGDTRFDRVTQIAAAGKDLPVIDKFRGDEKILLAGSSWRRDEEIIAAYINADPGKMKWIFAPHEIEKSNIDRLERLFKTEVVRYSCFNEGSREARVLIIDNIGILSSAYRYAYIAAVGGGFGDGIHSILEPACWGTPVLFGPNYSGFREAYDLISEGGAFCYRNQDEFNDIIDKLLADNMLYKSSSNVVAGYIRNNSGATEKIFSILIGD
jgi:3-deoxy-D-manno-octulosonic-acid transferase